MKKKKSKAKAPKKAAKKSKKVAPKKKVLSKKTPAVGNKFGVTPLGDKVLVKPAASETTTAFGIIIPDTAKEKPETGVVVAVGTGRRNENGSVTPVGVKVGDKVMFSKYGFDEVKVGGVEYYLISETNILAVLN